MRIVILSRGAQLYSTQSLLRAAMRAGHEAEIFDYTQLNCILAADGRVRLTYEGEDLEQPDAVLGRFSPTYTPLGASLMALLAAGGSRVSPSPTALPLARDKWQALTALRLAGVPVPATAMLNDAQELSEVAERLGGYPLVIKLLESTHGAGVVLARDAATARSILDAFASLHRGVLVQAFAADTGGADVRAIVCGGRVVAAMRRRPAPGEFRSNLHRGGSAEATELDARERDAVLRATAALQLEIAGVDLLRTTAGPLVLEVNASPGLEGIEGATGIDVAGAMIDTLAKGASRR